MSLILVTVMAVVALFPVYWMMKGSFENIIGSAKMPPNLLPRIDLINYIFIFTRYPALRWIANSLIIAAMSTLLIVLFSCSAGYAFAKKEFPGKNLFFWMMLVTMMIPAYVTYIPMFMMVKSLGMINTYQGIILPMCTGAGGMFLARQFMSSIPSELIDIARIDGASELRVFFLIILPISKPLVAALSIFSFCAAWCNFLWPLIVTSTDKMRPLTVAVVGISAQSNELLDIGMAMAGATLVALPMYVIFFSFQKYFTKGITLGGVKG